MLAGCNPFFASLDSCPLAMATAVTERVRILMETMLASFVFYLNTSFSLPKKPFFFFCWSGGGFCSVSGGGGAFTPGGNALGGSGGFPSARRGGRFGSYGRPGRICVVRGGRSQPETVVWPLWPP